MKNIYNLIFLLSFSFAFAQAPNISWLKNYGGSSSEYASKILPTSDGGYMVAGATFSADGDVSINKGSRDFWLLKLDVNGNKQWEKTYGGSADDLEATGIVELVGGGFVVSGYTSSNDGDVTTNKGGIDVWVLRIDSTGNIIWQKTYGGSLNDSAYDLIATNDGGYILVGTTFSNDGDVTVNRGNSDLWLVKIDDSGSLVWQRTYGGSFNENASTIKATLDGNYIVGGYTTSSNGNVSSNKGNSDFWVIKINDSGNLLWEKTFGGGSVEGADDILATSDGGYIVIGDTKSPNGDVSNPLGSNDLWVLKLDSAGTLIWEKTFGGAGEEYGLSLDFDSNGGYIISGYTNSNDGDVSVSLGNDDIWIVKVDDLGNLIWEKSFGGTLDDLSSNIIEISNGNYMICGNTRSGNGDMPINKGFSDLWVAELETNELSINDMEQIEISVYPNPAKNYFFVKSNETVVTEVYNIRGEKVLSGIMNNLNPMDINKLSTGMYTLKIKLSSGKTLFKKLVVNN